MKALRDEKVRERQLSGNKLGGADPAAHGREGQKGETNKIVAEKLGMG